MRSKLKQLPNAVANHSVIDLLHAKNESLFRLGFIAATLEIVLEYAIRKVQEHKKGQ
jgi:hypothetical protein